MFIYHYYFVYIGPEKPQWGVADYVYIYIYIYIYSVPAQGSNPDRLLRKSNTLAMRPPRLPPACELFNLQIIIITYILLQKWQLGSLLMDLSLLVSMPT